MKKSYFLVIILSSVLSLSFTFSSPAKNYKGKKILLINSYHDGLPWSDGEIRGMKSILDGSGVEFKIEHMDTKINPSDEFKVQAGIRAKKVIDTYKPDVVIVADDNAFKYVIMPYYRDSDLPVVFCGINWDISVYGGPYSNTTGIIEVGLTSGLYNHMKKLVKGNRVGFIGPDVLSEHKNAEHYEKYIEGGYAYKEFVKDFQSWKKAYLEMQDKVDMFIVPGHAGIKGWDSDKATEFIFENINKPIATESEDLMAFALMALSKVSEEQGEQAALSALRILGGEKPIDIPIVFNKKGHLVLNLKVADKLNIIYTPAMLRNAKAIIGLEEQL
tara:strand:- start:888 stop:1877 length:990 start_codon:yes stop_codon:yes gene_type:complete